MELARPKAQTHSPSCRSVLELDWNPFLDSDLDSNRLGFGSGLFGEFGFSGFESSILYAPVDSRYADTSWWECRTCQQGLWRVQLHLSDRAATWQVATLCDACSCSSQIGQLHGSLGCFRSSQLLLSVPQGPSSSHPWPQQDEWRHSNSFC